LLRIAKKRAAVLHQIAAAMFSDAILMPTTGAL